MDSAVCVGTLQTLSVKQSTVNAKTPPVGVSIFFFFLREEEGKTEREEWESDFFHQTIPQKPYSETDEEIKIFEGGRDAEMKWG